MSEVVTISKKKYLKMLTDIDTLNCLNGGGVDDWDWYSDSLEDHQEAINCNELGEEVVWLKEEE